MTVNMEIGQNEMFPAICREQGMNDQFIVMLWQYADEVHARTFPGDEHTYKKKE